MSNAFSKALAGICLLLLMLTTLFISPGWRHAHENGNGVHSHDGSHSHPHNDVHSNARSHSHGDHGQHGHRHHHKQRPKQSNPAAGDQISESRSHIHLTILWFEVTLPDFLGPTHSVASSGSDSVRGRSTRNGELVEFSSPFSFSQLIHVLLLAGAPIPDRVCLLFDCSTSAQLAVTAELSGRLPDAPPTPPPDVA